MRVFVLGTGRCGSLTFVAACSHFDNFTAGHETRGKRRLGDDRFAYADQHIEADNRLSWFLGGLGERFDGDDTLYVHLTRDREATAQSFLKRWGGDSPWRGGIISAFAHGMLMQSQDWPVDQRIDVCRFYVDTVTQNVESFLAGRRHLNVHLEAAQTDFAHFIETIGATGDLDAALGEWAIAHNASEPAEA